MGVDCPVALGFLNTKNRDSQMNIQILPSEVVNKIAAGEVLERPANLVKELIENSLDAGATEVHLDIDSGGREVKIFDNGHGISPSQLGLALERHATSKIRSQDDLWKLSSYGFRGEALSSIAAVSKLSITSRQPHDPQGAKIESEYGVLREPVEISSEKGTKIEIKNLFENVPARKKFLKSDGAELSQIKRVIKSLALANPQVSFFMRQKSKLLMSFVKRSSWELRAQDVLELQKTFFVEGVNSYFKAKIVYASPMETFANSQNIWILVQGRWVQDRTVQAAVLDAFRSLLMHGEFPCVAIALTCSPEFVDVNVHPSKSQVKFENSTSLYSLIQNTLRTDIEKARWIPKSQSPSMEQMSPQNSQESFATDRQVDETSWQVRDREMGFVAAETSPSQPSFQLPFQNEEKSSFWGSLKFKGQVNTTYLLAESQSSLFIVDQHAAHERVLYEKLMENWKQKNFEVQSFLIPLALTFATHSVEALIESSVVLKNLGFEIDQQGPDTLVVRAAPAYLSQAAIKYGLEKMADEITSKGGSQAIEKVLGEIFASFACHSAVRAGQQLSEVEAQALLRQMDNYSLSTFCPHGRPVFLDIPFKKLDKDFGRLG